MSEQEHHHAIPFKFLIRTFLTLLVLTVVTVLAAMFDFSDFNDAVKPLNIDFTPLNITLAMLIAIVKASLVATFFMGLYFDKKLNVSILVANVVFVFIFFVITLSDTLYRGIIDEVEGKKLQFESPVEAAKDKGSDSEH